MKLASAHLDGLLYLVIAVTGAGGIATSLGSDEAVKFIEPNVLFYSKMINAAIFTAATALKTFRSTSFADHKEEQKAKSNGNGHEAAKPSESAPNKAVALASAPAP